MMRIILLTAIALLLSTLMIAEVACTRSNAVSRKAPRGTRGLRLPDPLPLPAEPVLAAHVARPGETFATLAPFAAPTLDRSEVISALLETWGAPELTNALTATIDFDRPWAAVQIGDEIVLHLAVRRDRLDTLRQALAARPAEGDFGAVRLGQTVPPVPAAASKRDPWPPSATAEPAARLAWLDAHGATLTLAHTLRGISTGQTLASAYGKDPLFVTVSSALFERFGVSVPVSRISLRGAHPKQFAARFENVARAEVPGLSEIAPGALTGLLGAPQVAWGASSRWARHEHAVQELIQSVRREVARQNFLIRGILEELSRRLEVVLRAWNGRVLVAGGPRNHLLVALGTREPERAETSVLHLAQGVVDNLKLAATFGLQVPDLALRRDLDSGGGRPIHQLTLRNAREVVPSELSMLLDDRQALHVAFAGSNRGSSALAAVGPRASQVLSAWLRDTTGAPPADASRDHLASASWAVDPNQVRLIMAQGRLQELLTLEAAMAPAVAVLRQEGQDLVLNVGPPANVD